jgi:hypothetical protein
MLLPEAAHEVELEADAELTRIVPENFIVTDAKSANWVVRRIQNARQYAEHVKAWADRECQRADREEKSLMYLFGRQLEAWTRAEIARTGKRRRLVALPAATMGFRHQTAHLIIDDDAAAILWAKQACPPAIQLVERLLKTPINAHFQATGEIPDGAHLEPERDVFRIS